MIKMASYHFIFNLCDHNYKSRQEGLSDPEGYLLSIHRYTPKFRRLAESLSENYDEIIMADNGYYSRIRSLIQLHAEESALLLQKVNQIERENGQKTRFRELPKSLLISYTQFAKKVRASVYTIEKEHALQIEDVLSEQMRIKPTWIVCPEDILLAALVGLNVEPEYLQLERSFYRYRNKRSGRFFQKAISLVPDDVKIISVASAVDYNSSYDAGKELAKVQAKDLAIGTGAYMVDNHYTDHYRRGRKNVLLKRSIPRRYIRTVLTAKGLVDGYYHHTRKYPESIHFLGLGTLIVMVMVAWVGRYSKKITFDATSPIKDAVEGVIYVVKPTYLKMKTHKLASYYAQNPDQKWDCDCAYCKKYMQKYPMDYARAHRFFLDQGEEFTVKKKDLAAGELADALPLFSMPRGGPIAKDINDWRVGHNHLMLTRAMHELRSARSESQLRAMIEKKVGVYIERSLPHYAYAIQTAWDLISRSNN